MSVNMEQDSKRSFWTTLPGVLTASAGLIAALGTLLGTLSQVGLIGGKTISEPPAKESPIAGVTGQRPAEATSPGDIILGTWRQEIFTTSSDLVDAGTFIVSKVEGRYVMGATEQTQRPDLSNSVALSDVACDGNVWTFQSKWKDGRIGYFRLRRISNSVFEGDVVRPDQEVDRNRWVRIAQ